MANYHFFIASAPYTPESQLAFSTAQTLIAEGKSIRQIFFYYEGVHHWKDPVLMAAWLSVTKNVRLCITYMEKYGYQFNDQNGVCATGLVDFFAIHWQDQGILLQF